MPTIEAKKFYEVQKNISLTGHIVDSLLTVVSGQVWSKLSDADKKAFTEVMQEAADKTGRGSAYGCAPSPSLKLSTNTALWVKQEEDIDLNCGEIVDGGATVAQVGEHLFRMMIDTASGTRSKSELHGYGQNEFVPWYVGAVM